MIMRQVKPSTRRALAYVRISTEGQDDKTSLGAQLDYIRRDAAARNVELCGEYAEVASAGNADRPELQRLMLDATNKENRIDEILVYDLSRFSRNPEDFFDLYGTLKRHNIQLKSVIEPHMGDEMSELLYAIITIFNSVLLPRIARLVRRGQFKATERGDWVSRLVPLGYQKYYVQDGDRKRPRLEKNPKTWDDTRRVWDLLLEAHSAGETSKIANREGIRTANGNKLTSKAVLDIGKNEAYLGHVTRGKKSKSPYLDHDEKARCENAHEAMVTQEEWDKVQGFTAGRARTVSPPRSHNSPNIFSEMVFCGKSNKKMVVHRTNKGYARLICQEKRNYGVETCNCENIDMHELHELVMGNLLHRVLTRKTYNEQVQLVGDQYTGFVAEEKGKEKRIKGRLTLIKTGKKNLLDSLEAYGPHESIGTRLENLSTEEGELAHELFIQQENIRTRATFVNDPKRIVAYALDMRTYLMSENQHTVKQFVKIFIEKMTIKDGEVTVEYKIPIPPVEGEGLVQSETMSLSGQECVLGTRIGTTARIPTCSATPGSWSTLPRSTTPATPTLGTWP